MSSVRRELSVHQKLSLDDCLRAARPENDYYQRLGLNRAAGKDAISARYREIAKVLHPDLHRERLGEVQAAMSSVNEAFDVLGDDDKKREYDRGGRSADLHGRAAYTGTATSAAEAWRDFAYSARAQENYPYEKSSLSKAEILDAATQALAVYDIGKGLTALKLLVQTATRAGFVTKEEFRSHRSLQEAFRDHAVNIWMKSKPAAETYAAYVEVLRRLGVANIQLVHDSVREFIEQDARRIWYDNSPSDAFDIFVNYCKHLKGAGAITGRDLTDNPEVRDGIKSAAAKIFEDMAPVLAPRMYGLFIMRCIGTDIISPSILHAHVRPTALLKTKGIFDDNEFLDALKIYAAYTRACEKLGLFSREDANAYIGLDAQLSKVQGLIEENFPGTEGRMLLQAFRRQCRDAGLEISDL